MSLFDTSGLSKRPRSTTRARIAGLEAEEVSRREILRVARTRNRIFFWGIVTWCAMAAIVWTTVGRPTSDEGVAQFWGATAVLIAVGTAANLRNWSALRRAGHLAGDLASTKATVRALLREDAERQIAPAAAAFATFAAVATLLEPFFPLDADGFPSAVVPVFGVGCGFVAYWVVRRQVRRADRGELDEFDVS